MLTCRTRWRHTNSATDGDQPALPAARARTGTSAIGRTGPNIQRSRPQARRTNLAVVRWEVSRRYLAYVFYAMRDGHVGTLDTPAAEQDAG